MNNEKVTVFTVIVFTEHEQRRVNTFTSYISARWEAREQAHRKGVLLSQVYEETIGIRGIKIIGLVDEFDSNVQL